MFPIRFFYNNACNWSIGFLQIVNISKLYHMLGSNHSTFYVWSFQELFPYNFLVWKCEPFFLRKTCKKWLLSIAFQVWEVPINPCTELAKHTGTPPVDAKTYQSLVGGLLHATISRWDIQYAIGCVSCYLTNPQMEHIIAAKNILHYLKGTLDYGLFFPKEDTG
jgi:hypothetical protein